jgi:serine phosphatase RsbU (regulator of sigma subunit)/anti-sigma regulatory factor (Ser/Thr protein kinase)
MTEQTTQETGRVLDAQRALAFLAQASAVLARSLDYERTLAEVAQLAVPEFSDWCAVDVVQPDGSLRQISSGHPDPRLEELLMELRRRYRAEKGRTEGAMSVIATGRPELRTDVKDAPRIRIPQDAEDLYEELAPRSYMIVPLTARGRTIGALTFLSTIEGRHYGEADLDFAQHLARRFGLAVDNARLYQEAQNARDRLSFMARASELLSRSLELDETLHQVALLAVSGLADWCSIELRDDDGSLRNAAIACVDPERVPLAQALREKYPIDPDDPSGVPNVIRTGRSELYPEIADELLVQGARDEDHLRLLREVGLKSVLIVPLTARGRTMGAITLVSTESGRQYGVEDLRFAEELAHRAAVAVDNSRLYSREHNAAVTLQQSLLPRQLPEVPGMEFAARYLPATSELDVGGDWYDAIQLSDGSVGVAIGDVVGHGVEAAAVMGQFRNALRAYVLDGRGPDAAVERLNRLTRTFDQNDMATLVYVVLDTATGGFRFVRAGHPPPLIRDVEGNVTQLNGQGALPVGVAPNVRYPATSMKLEPGSTLLLYTDGLVERRGEPLEEGIANLERVLADAPEPLEELCDHLLASLAGDDQRDDDIALLVMRPIELEAERFHTTLRADPTELSRLRRLLMRWLRMTQASAQEIYDITIAAGEACANAIEHAYGARTARFEVEGTVDESFVTLRVRDYGNWRAPRGEHRGRGLQLIEALMEDVQIERSEHGTEVRMRRRLSALERR